jgi:predicted glycosyltransferase
LLLVRVWVDLTNSPHVLVFRPLIGLLRERGAEVEVTARAYAQTLELLDLHGIEAHVVGRHGGGSTVGKARVELARLAALRRWASGRRFDLALGHGSHDLTLTARSLGVPSATTFDYEFAWLQHQLGCRAATRVVVPEAIPEERLARYGVGPTKLRRYPGLKEEYYLADFEADPDVPGQLGVDTARRLVVVRTPPEVALYHRHGNPLFLALLERLGRDARVHAVVLPRTTEQRERIRGLGLPSLLVPERALDAQSLIAAADAVVSAGGTMNREAVALGVPVYTTFGGRLGAVDEALVRDGLLVQLRDAAGLDLDALPSRRPPLRRDPNLLLELLLGSERR